MQRKIRTRGTRHCSYRKRRKEGRKFLFGLFILTFSVKSLTLFVNKLCFFFLFIMMHSSAKSRQIVALLRYSSCLTLFSQDLCHGDEANSRFSNVLVSLGWPDKDTLEVKFKGEQLFLLDLTRSSKSLSFLNDGSSIACETMVSITNVLKDPDCRSYDIKYGDYGFEVSVELAESQPGDEPTTMTHCAKDDPDSTSIISLIRIKGEITVSIKLPNKAGEELTCTFPVTLACFKGRTNQGNIRLIATKI